MKKRPPGIRGCLLSKVKAGKLTREQADQVMEEIKRLQDEYAASMSPEAAAAAANTEAAKRRVAAAERAKRLTQMRIGAAARIVPAVEAHPNGVTAGALAHLVRDIHDKPTGIQPAEIRKEVVLGQLHGMFADGMAAYRSKVAGLTQDTLGIRNLVRELYGEGTGDAVAANAAKAWDRTAAYAKDRFVVAGGDIATREDWRLPQHHERRQIRAVTADEWRDFMLPLLDRNRMVDFETGAPISGDKLDEIIAKTYRSIVTDGLSDLTPGGHRGSGAVANKHSAHRLFAFKDAESWLKYNDRFGGGRGGIYELLTGHLDTMARDIALIETLGPNPTAMVRYLEDMSRKAEAEDPVTGIGRFAPVRAVESPAMIQRAYDQLTGALNRPESELVAGIFSGLRSWGVTTKMGSAIISSVTDLATIRQTARWNGLSAAKVGARMARQLNPANAADRAFAVRLGLVAGGWTDRALGVARYQGDDFVAGGRVSEFMGRLASFVIRAQGLSAWTQAGRQGFAMEFLGFLADQSGRAFADVSKPLRRAFDRYGIGPAEWDIIRAAPAIEHKGARFASVDNVAAGKTAGPEFDAANRMMEMVDTEMRMAIPEPGARERALLSFGRRGTFWGEVVRSVSMFRSFAVTMMTTHLMRGAIQPGVGGKMAYLAPLAVGLTVMGALAIQMRQIATGKDPRDMTPTTSPEFWGAAFMQGGGLGILGDFLYTPVARNDRDVSGTLVGPLGGTLDDVLRIGLGNAGQAARGEKTNAGAELARFIRYNAPGGNLWYSRLATDRLLMDQLQSMLDPEYRKSFARIERAAQRDYGQGYWWRPGQTKPTRAPDLGAISP